MALTNKEAIASYFNFEVPENLLEKVMIDRSVTPTQNYSSVTEKLVDLAAADICFSLVNVASEAEGGLSITYDPGKLKELRATLLAKHDETENEAYGMPTIRNADIW